MIPPEHIDLMQLANAGIYPEKETWFYPFKDRLLRSHGRRDGWDRQTIEHQCWNCRGKGYWTQCMHCGYAGPCDNCYHPAPKERRECDRCDKGIYSVEIFYLERFFLGDTLFHIPSGLSANEPPTCLFIEDICGKVKHPPVESKTARMAAFKLFSFYEPELIGRLEADAGIIAVVLGI